jgi:catechol 2,3-dioxygenase-like lactoylglutathione lyase family enzyme
VAAEKTMASAKPLLTALHSTVRRVKLEQLDHIAIAVSDMDRSIGWYRDVLGLERRHPEWGTVPAMMCTGNTCIALFQIQTHAPHPPPGRDTIAMRHIAFRASREVFESAQRELAGRGIVFELADHDTAHSIYFNDPDGHELEITTYEL